MHVDADEMGPQTRRAGGWPAAVLMVIVGLAMAACSPGTGEGSGRSEGPSSPIEDATPQRPQSPTEADVGEPMALDALPRMPDEGVAVQLDEGLVLVDLDGVVHGHVPGATLETVRGLQHAPAGLVPAGDDEHGVGWVEPSTGVFWPGYWGTPLVGEASVLLDPNAGSPDAYVIHRPDEAVAQWDRDAPWWLSADHRTVTWATCPEAGDTAGCPRRGHDLDMGGDLDLDPGCWVADARGDFTQLRVCANREVEPRSWLQLAVPGEGARRYELPHPSDMPEGMPTTGHFLSAELGGSWILAQASLECEVRKAALIDADTAELHPLLGEQEPLDAASLALGWTGDGRAAVLVHDGPCAEETDEPGVWLVDPADGDSELVYPLPRETTAEAHLWRPVPGIDVSAREGGGG